MYLSRILLPLTNRYVASRLVADPYALHQAILKGFPPDAPYGGGRVLWRLEPQGARSNVVDGVPVAALLVQSEREPNWRTDRVQAALGFEVGDELAQTKLYDPKFTEGQRLRFRLRANPVRLARKDKDGNPLPKPVRAVRNEAQAIAWMARKATECGLELTRTDTSSFDFFDEADPGLDCRATDEGFVKSWSKAGQASEPLTYWSVLFDGSALVRDPALLADSLPKGIGRGKAFGFGLLSLMRG